jgi:hypothetical protein
MSAPLSFSRFATELLPSAVRFSPCDLDLQLLVNKRSRIFLDSRQDVRVEVQRDPHIAVAEFLARDLRIDAQGQHVGRASVPQIMKPDDRQTERLAAALPVECESVRTQRGAVIVCADVRLAGRPNTKLVSAN